MTGISKKRKLWKLWRSVRSTHGFCKIGIPESVARSSLKAECSCSAAHTRLQPGKLLATKIEFAFSTAQTTCSCKTKISTLLSMNSSVRPLNHLILPLTSSNKRSGSNPDTPPKAPTETASNGTTAPQPIPPPSEPMQYRDYGSWSLQRQRRTIYPRYVGGNRWDRNHPSQPGSDHEFGQESPNLEQEHLWWSIHVLGNKTLHLQIVGVWEPEKLSRDLPATETSAKDEQVGSEQFVHELEHPSSEIEDGYFSIRGEIVYQSASDKHFVVKIKQAPRKDSDKPKYFKLNLL